MEGFIKETQNSDYHITKITRETQKKYKLDGYKKTAILLAEIGGETSNSILNSLNLRDKQIKKIRKAMSKLGKYDPKNSKMVKRELLVLSETLNYGKMKGIFNPDVKQDAFVTQNQKDISNMIQNNPNDIANLLKTWIGDK